MHPLRSAWKPVMQQYDSWAWYGQRAPIQVNLNTKNIDVKFKLLDTK